MHNDASLKEQQDTRTHIAQVAIKLFAHQGFDGTSIRDIAETSGVTKPSLYYYFNSKEDLYSTVIHEVYDTFIHELHEIIESKLNFLDRFKQVVQYYIDDCEKNDDIIRLIFGALFSPRRNKSVVDIIELEKRHVNLLKEFFVEGIEGGYIRETAIEPLVFHFLGSITMYFMLRIVPDENFGEDYELYIIDFVLNGIGGRKEE